MPQHFARPDVLVVALLVCPGCGGGSSDGTPAAPPAPPPAFSFSLPNDIGDGWQVGDLAAEGFDTQRVVDMMDRILDATYPRIDSVAMVRSNDENTDGISNLYTMMQSHVMAAIN